MDVNVASMFLMCRAVVPVMRERGGGKIVNISSGTPFRGVPFLLHYVTSKGAIVAFTRALAKEVGKDDVLVNCVAPGFTMSAGVEAHPEVVEKLRDVSVVGAHAPARPGAGGRRRRGRVPLRPRLRLRHRPDDRDRRRPDLPLILRAHRSPGRRRDRARRPRRLRRRRGRGALRRRPCRRARARLGADRAARRRVARSAATASTSRPAASRYLHTHPGPGLRVLLDGPHPHRHARARRTSTARSSGGTRPAPTRSSRRPPRPRTTAFVRVLVLPREWAGQADDHVRRPRRRGEAEAAARPHLPRAAAVSRHGGKLLVDQLVVHGTDIASASRARATSRCSTASTTRRSA